VEFTKTQQRKIIQFTPWSLPVLVETCKYYNFWLWCTVSFVYAVNGQLKGAPCVDLVREAGNHDKATYKEIGLWKRSESVCVTVYRWAYGQQSKIHLSLWVTEQEEAPEACCSNTWLFFPTLLNLHHWFHQRFHIKLYIDLSYFKICLICPRKACYTEYWCFAF